ncbi:acyltransferase [Geomonas subterranea]|uniref:Acyltransferase n=1 Tax=Geomonas subterranea TaxID=2847989 RepID=A0ABX8LGX5_9BACT|nr:acyltransferase [Geomonas subterranea]QXE90596.1 acyltransferase [Geomonas subterranea]QXM11324.1 acyltransferase [Geomonas subterranea]
MFLSELLQRIRFWKAADRIGPDIPYTHWRLHFKSTMLRLCKEKFLLFDDSADFRPGAYAICCSKISIGKRVVVRPTTMFFADPREGGAGITIEDDVMMGSGVHLYVNNHRFDSPDIPIIDQGHYVSEPVVLKKGCWLGANVIVLPGVTIGENSVVGAGSLVTKSVPAGVLAAGNPARIIRNIGDQAP